LKTKGAEIMDILLSLLSFSELAFGRSINKDNYVIITIVALVVVFGMIFIIAYGVWASRRKHQIKTLQKLTSDLGLDFFKRGKRNETDWCVGKYKDFNLTMQGRTVTYRGEVNVNHLSSVRMSVAYVIRLCISLPGISINGAKVGRTVVYDQSLGAGKKLDSFDEAFNRQEGTENLPETVKEGMLKFVQNNKGAFLFNDPQQVSKGHLPEGAFTTDPTIVVLHDPYLKDIRTDTEKLRQILDDLTDLVGTIQTAMG
jgi:hypothetical protein